MKRKLLQLTGIALATMLMASPAIAFDNNRADAYAQMFASVQGPKAGKKLHLIKPEQFVNEVRAGKKYVTVDIRTPGETMFFTGNLPGHLVIPLKELFKHDQLAKLPNDKPIVIFCQAGERATAAATALRDLGFKETYVLKGGFKGLSAFLGPKQANQPLGPKTAAR